MRALVTGGTGFLGGALARRLRLQGDAVTVLGRNRTAGARLQAENMRFVWADLTDAAAVNAACAEQEVVFHCGATVAPWGRYQDFYATNVSGTQNIIRGCLEHKVARLIYVSIPSLYFAHQDRLNVGEYHPLPAKLVNAYTITKFQAEQAIDRAYRNELPVITLRPRAIFGPGDTTILPRVIHLGNCIAASIPATLYAAIRQARLQRGDEVLLVGTGAGLSLGGVILVY